MRLDELTVTEFKNLRDLYIHFHEKSPYTVLVGQNGSGKSNLIEALANIFRKLGLDETAPFGYKLQYECRGHLIRAEAEKSQYARTIAPARSKMAGVLVLERRLSDLVSEAYGLTADEVRLMWESAPPRIPLAPARQ